MADTLKKAKDYVNKLLLPLENHYYHSYGHALDVMHRATYLAEKEGLSKDEINMLALAGLFHDTGFIIQYDDNEPIGATIAGNYLRSILYPNDRIKTIQEIILATSPKYKNPKNIYEKIIMDADMDNIGRDDFFTRNNDLKKEIEIIKNIKIKDPDWLHASVQLLKEHNFITKSQKEERDPKRIDNLKKLEKELQE